MGAPLAIEYPPAQEVRDGEPLLLELMANPVTGEKLSDVIRVSSTTRSPEPWRLAIIKGTIKINGEELRSSGGCAGRYVWFSLPGRGRFVVSAEEVPGYDFTSAELIDNRIIKFAAAGDTYEWTSTHPVATGVRVPERLWVWNDTETMPNGGHGAMDTLPRR